MSVPSPRRRGAVPLLVLLALGIATVASAMPPQVWVVARIDDPASGRVADVRVPLEWVRDVKPAPGDTAAGAVPIDGSWIYDAYRDLPQGKEAEVMRARESGADVLVRAVSHAGDPGPVAQKIHVVVADMPGVADMDMTVPLKALGAMQGMVARLLRMCTDCPWDRIDPARIEAHLGELGNYAPFQIVRVSGAKGSVLVETKAG